MRIIPAIDIINGKCVRLSKGDYSTAIIYNENPFEVAKEFEANGLKFLHLVDLDGAKSNHIVNYKILNEIATKTKLKIDFGGGLKSNKDLKTAFENGAAQITGGSIAVHHPDLFIEWLHQYGPEKIILGADVKKRNIVTNGWINNSAIDVLDFIQDYQNKKIKYVICSDVDKDGMLAGSSNDLYKEILSKTTVKLIASGGVSSVADLIKLKDLGCEAVIVGKAIYEQKISLKEIKDLC